MPKSVVFAEWKKAKEDAESIVIELSEGTMTIPPVTLWGDPARDADGKLETNEQFMRRIVGDVAYDQFLADGGTYAAFAEILEQHKGLPPGE